MADTKQLTILKRLTSHLQGITADNGYDYDLSQSVFRGRTVFGPEDVLPYVSILESLRPDPRPEGAGTEKLNRLDDWELLVQGWADDDREHPTDQLYQLKGAVEKRLAEIQNPASPVYRLGDSLIVGLRIGPGVVRPATPEPGGAEAFFLPLLVRYNINLSDPYSLR